MESIIDANVLFRILISRGEILDIVSNPNLSLFAPERLKEEFIKHKDEISAKSSLTSEEFDEFASELFNIIETVPFEEYSSFIPEAKELLKTHDKDEDFVALALSKDCKVWTYESLLFSLGMAISTKELSTILSKLF